MSPAIQLDSFNLWIGWALGDVRAAAAFTYPAARRSCFDAAMKALRHALTAANKLGCPDRKALCLRVMNWIRSDLRRAAC